MWGLRSRKSVLEETKIKMNIAPRLHNLPIKKNPQRDAKKTADK